MALIKCTHCGKETNNKRDKCLLCGKEIPENLRFKEEIPVKEKVKLDKSSAKENPESNTKNCPFCFEEIKKQAIKCKHCNEFQEHLTEVKDNKDDIQKNKTKKQETIAYDINGNKTLAAQGGCKTMIKWFLIPFVPGMILIYFLTNSNIDACECVEAYDKMHLNEASDKIWDSCNRQWKKEAEEAWLKNNPNHSFGEYAQKWGSYYNDGMVKAYLKKECSR